MSRARNRESQKKNLIFEDGKMHIICGPQFETLIQFPFDSK